MSFPMVAVSGFQKERMLCKREMPETGKLSWWLETTAPEPRLASIGVNVAKSERMGALEARYDTRCNHRGVNLKRVPLLSSGARE